MKNRVLRFLSMALLVWGVAACQSPEELMPSVSRSGINSFTASFPNNSSDDNKFTSEIDYVNHVIKVVVPYYYPANSFNVVTTSMLTNMRVKASLDDNVNLSPSLLSMDLSKENYFTLIDQQKKEIPYKVIAEIRKSNKCEISEFKIPSLGLSGVINEEKKTIALISLESIGQALAEVTTSHAATITPDPRLTAFDYDNPVEFTVTAHNGVDKAVYTVSKMIPSKTEAGIRSGSGKLMWAKKLVDVGITTINMTGGISVTDKYVVINTRNENSVYLDARTGEKQGGFSLGAIQGSFTNFYATADESNHILVCNLIPNAGAEFKIWKIADVNASPEPFITWPTTLAIGRKFSVRGNITTDAIITAPILAAGGKFARWRVSGGTLLSQTPDIITTTGTAWTTNADVVYSSATNPSADYFIAYYGAPYKITWYNGADNTVKVQGTAVNSNWVVNAVDHTVFNKVSYLLHSSINSFTWGKDDSIYLYDLSSSNFNTSINVCEAGIYGANAAGGAVNGTGTGDVAFKVSDNGYYLYVYFMFTNGYVVCYQYDCIKM